MVPSRLRKEKVQGLLVATAAAVAALTAAAGCASSNQHFGGRPFPVMVRSVPAGATLYVIPNTVWDKYRDDLFTKPYQDKLDLYRVTSTNSPAEVMVEAKTYMIVAERGNDRRTQRYTPRTPHETVDVQAPPATDKPHETADARATR